MKEMVKLTVVTLSPSRKVMVMPNTYKKTEKDPDYFLYLWDQRKEGAGKTRHRKRFITGGGLKCGKN